MNINKKISLLLLSSMVFILMACPKDDTKSDLEIKTENVSRTWIVSSVSSNASGDANDYKEIEMTLAKGGTYTMENPKSVPSVNTPAKKASGTWKFSDDLAQIIFDAGTSDEKVIDLKLLSATSVVFEFEGKVGPKDTNKGIIEYTMIPKP